jgi:hypothetical protein
MSYGLAFTSKKYKINEKTELPKTRPNPGTANARIDVFIFTLNVNFTISMLVAITRIDLIL